ncbi:MAG: hypothetical protein ACXWT3_04190 [Methylococcaceae bacterium]
MKTRFTKNYLSLIISSLLLLPAVNNHAGETTRVSVDSGGNQGNNQSFYSSISADGRFVAFESLASLTPEDTNGLNDIFVHDRSTRTTTRVSVSSAGEQSTDEGSFHPAISADGRFVTFTSWSTILVPDHTIDIGDILVRDMATNTTSLVSVNLAAAPRNFNSEFSSISADGRFIAFLSAATNLVPEDTNDKWDVFVRDQATGIITRVSVDSRGRQGNGHSVGYFPPAPAISADGRFVAFYSESSNLVPGDNNFWGDIFVHDRTTGKTTLVNVDSMGVQGNHFIYRSISISADGRFVAFVSGAANLVAGDTNAAEDAFVHDRNTRTTTRVSVDSTGLEANDHSLNSVISADGRFVAFYSVASNLVQGDTNGIWDAFVHDRSTGTTTRVGVDSMGKPGNDWSSPESISADGRFIGFSSGATNLVQEDTNGSPDVFVRDRQLVQNKTADLQLAVTSQPASALSGQTASYTYTLTNNGPDNINTEVKLTDVIAQGSVVSLTPSRGFCSKAVVSVCRFGALATGADVTLTAVIKANGNPLTQQLSVNAPPVDNAPGNNSVTVSTPVTP